MTPAQPTPPLPTISATMVVRTRDQEDDDMLFRCLKSIRHICDEIVIIDTGSTEKGLEIENDFGAFVVTTKWQDNFALHRNQAFGYASGDWYFVIDHDEELLSDIIPEPFKKKLSMIDGGTNSLAVVVEENQNGRPVSWLGNRFFRASVNPRYIYEIHNRIKIDGYCAPTDIRMAHYGYSLSPEKMAVKNKRTEDLLRKRIEKDPCDYDAHYYLCVLLMGKLQVEEAIFHGTKCMELLPVEKVGDFSFYGTIYYYLAMLHLRNMDGEKAYAWAKKGLEYFPNDIDLNYAMARIGYMSERDDILKPAGTKYLELLPTARDRLHFAKDGASFQNPAVRDGFVNRTRYSTSKINETEVKKWLDPLR